MAVNWLLLYEAFTLIGVSVATIINFCAPIIVVVLSPLIFSGAADASETSGTGACGDGGISDQRAGGEPWAERERAASGALCDGDECGDGDLQQTFPGDEGNRQCGASAGCGAHCRTVIFAVRGDSIFRFRWETGFQSCGWGSSARHSVICSFFHHRETSRPDRIALRLSGACFGSCFSGSHTERNDDAGADSRSGIDRGRRCLGRRAVQKIYAV